MAMAAADIEQLIKTKFPDAEIVMVAGSPPIRAKKARYFEDKRFVDRAVPPPSTEM